MKNNNCSASKNKRTRFIVLFLLAMLLCLTACGHPKRAKTVRQMEEELMEHIHG